MRSLSYRDLKARLMEHFGGEIMHHVRALQDLKQGNKSLLEHNKKFSRMAAAASADMKVREQRELYLNSIHPALKLHLASVSSGLSL